MNKKEKDKAIVTHIINTSANILKMLAESKTLKEIDLYTRISAYELELICATPINKGLFEQGGIVPTIKENREVDNG